MDLNRFLPSLISAGVALAVLGAIGLPALAWTRSFRTRLWIKRTLLILVLIILGGPFIYWFATWGTEGVPRHTVDRSMQQKQQDELRQRVHQGGH